jgi:hypothetical protein
MSGFIVPARKITLVHIQLAWLSASIPATLLLLAVHQEKE